MSKKNKILLSITGISLVLLILLGVTYAYYRTRVIGNKSETSISVTSKNMILKYDDGNGIITFEKLNPGNSKVKTFSVINQGNTEVDYTVYLENIINELTRKEDMTYKLTCESTDSNNPCPEETRYVEFPSKDTSLVTTNITANTTHTYRLTLKYANLDDVDQSVDMGSNFNVKINIYDTADVNKENFGNILSTLIMNDERIEKNTTTPTFLSNELADTKEDLYKTEDDYGTTWYFRGAQPYNFVKFAGFTWRIVRINGDGSIRLILDNVLNTAKHEDEANYAGETSAFNNPYGDNAYVGYMYGTPKSTSYDATHANTNSSTIKQAVDAFYEKYIEEYNNYLADSIFCGDKTIATNVNEPNPEFPEDINTKLGYGVNKTYYGAIERHTYDENKNSLTELSPTLKCANDAIDAYSRYTVDVQTTTLTNVKTNGDLSYPIGLLSVDEVVFAGGQVNSSYHYLSYNPELPSDNATSWWTMTPGSASIDYPKKTSQTYDEDNIGDYGYTSNMYYVQKNSKFSSNDGNVERGVRPVINLKSNVTISFGDGTKTNPYVID